MRTKPVASAKNAMKNLTVRARIILGFAAVLLIMLVLGGLVFTHLIQINAETTSLSTDSIPGESLMNQIEAASMDNHAVTRATLNTPPGQAIIADPTSKRTTIGDLKDLCSQYHGTITTKEDSELFAQVDLALNNYAESQKRLIASRPLLTTVPARAEALRELDANFKSYDDLVNQEVTLNHRNSKSSAAGIGVAVKSAQSAIAIGLLISLVLAAVSGAVLVRAINLPLAKVVQSIDPMRRGDLSHRLNLVSKDEFGVLAEGLNGLADDLTSIIGQVQKATMQVNSSVTEIAATAREQQATASEIAATTIEVGATSREISATSKELVRSMNDVSGVAERTAELAADGQTGLGRMENTMHQIMEASGSISDRLGVLNERAGNIGAVVTTISKVADQTNLLSLNAAIEAEKAGEYGRGFAVVASEIRRLADQTAVATLDIEQMVKEMQSAVSAGVMGLDKFSEAVRRGVEVVGSVSEQLAQIIAQVQLLTPNFETVNEGMQSQSTGAQQISDALSQLSEAAQQTVDSLEQSNLAIDGLNSTVRGLQSSVSRFTLAN